MQISSFSAATQVRPVQRKEPSQAKRAGSGFGEAIQSEFQKDQVSLSPTGRNAQTAVLSASEKSFFNDSFGMTVFGADSVKGSVLGKQAAKVLDSQEINFFQDSFSDSSQIGSYSRSGLGQSSHARSGITLNMLA